MNVIESAADLKPGANGVYVAIGVFDGVHLGHQRVIGQACAEARKRGAISAVVTFDRHPNAVVAPQNVPPLIYPLSNKLRVIAALGVDACWVIRFDKAFSQISGEQFVRGLARDFKVVRGIFVGETFTFGCRRSGNIELLGALGEELGYELSALSDVSLDGKPVSSTRIREAVREGQFEAAGRLLGRSYTLCGKVIAGEKIGRKLGFPTANLDVTNILIPPLGVYAADAHVAGKTWRGAVNIGYRPTVHANGPVICVEAHLLDFAGDIYGQEIELTFLGKLRDEQKFPHVAALRQQIEKDIAASRQIQAWHLRPGFVMGALLHHNALAGIRWLWRRRPSLLYRGVSKPDRLGDSNGPPTRRSAIQQFWKPALQYDKIASFICKRLI